MKRQLIAITLVFISFSVSFSQVSIVADINSGSESSDLAHFTTVNGVMYFRANDGVNGNELWQYDGLTSPSMVADIAPGSADSYPSDLVEFNNKLYFGANDGVHGFEMWEYDGVNPPTLFADIEPSGNGALYYGAYFFEFNNKLYFQARDGVAGGELWEYDGTNPPTLFADLAVGAGSSAPIGFTIFNGKLYFNAVDESAGFTRLWVYDGTNPPTIATTVIKPFLGRDNMMVMNGKLYLGGDDGINGLELWEYDGVNDPTIVADIVPGSVGSFPAPQMVFANKLYFRANGEYWVYDGSNSPTQEMTITTGLEFNGDLHFGFDNGVNGRELGSFDGANPPSLVADINPNSDSYPFTAQVLNDKLYFVADDGTNGRELWVYEGDNSNSVSEFEQNVSVSIFPNPSSSIISIASEAQINEVLIFNLFGSLVKRENQHTFSVENLANGVYVMNIQTSKGIRRSRFIKE